jgi:hypothetical protein
MFGALQAQQQLSYAREEGRTIRQPSTALFTISSTDRFKDINQRRESPTYPFKFRISKNESLLNGFFTRLGLSEFRILWSLPNISPIFGTDAILLGTGNLDAPLLIQVPQGFYTPSELATAMNAVCVAKAYPCTITFDAGSGVITFTGNGTDIALNPYTTVNFPLWDNATVYPAGSAVQFGNVFYSAVSAVVGQNPSLGGWNVLTNPAELAYSGYQIFDMLNLQEGAGLQASIPSGIPMLRWTDYIDIVCSQLTYQQELKDASSQPANRDMVARIYLDESVPSDATYATAGGAGYGAKVNGCRPFILYRQFSTPKQIRWARTQPIGQVEFEIFDDQGRSIYDMLQAFARLPSSETSFADQQLALSSDFNMTILVSED